MKDMIAAVAALLVGFVAYPSLEWWKSRLLRSSQRELNKKKLVAQLRFILGYLSAFYHELTIAYGTEERSGTMYDDQLEAVSRVRLFDLGPVRDQAGELAALELEALRAGSERY